MRNRLNYQSTEYDCGPTSLVNAIRFLFDREEIDPGLIKGIWHLGNDTYNEEGCPGKHGTSMAAACYIASWINGYAKGWKFPLKTEYMSGLCVQAGPQTPIDACLESGGCAVIRCWTGEIPHYVLLTCLTPDGFIGLWDPYDEAPDLDPEKYRIISDSRQMNRMVRVDVLNSTGKEDYAMGAEEHREVILFTRTDGKDSL